MSVAFPCIIGDVIRQEFELESAILAAFFLRSVDNRVRREENIYLDNSIFQFRSRDLRVCFLFWLVGGALNPAGACSVVLTNLNVNEASFS